MKIKDIQLVGTVHEGRVLPIVSATGVTKNPGPVRDSATIASTLSATSDDHGHAGDACVTGKKSSRPSSKQPKGTEVQ